MAHYQLLLRQPPTAKAELGAKFTETSHEAAIATVDASLEGKVGDEADAELEHLISAEDPVTVAKWARRDPDRVFKRVG
jgi:hypothetical protein